MFWHIWDHIFKRVFPKLFSFSSLFIAQNCLETLVNCVWNCITPLFTPPWGPIFKNYFFQKLSPPSSEMIYLLQRWHLKDIEGKNHGWFNQGPFKSHFCVKCLSFSRKWVGNHFYIAKYLCDSLLPFNQNYFSLRTFIGLLSDLERTGCKMLQSLNHHSNNYETFLTLKIPHTGDKASLNGCG